MIPHDATYDTPEVHDGASTPPPVHIGRVLRDAILFNPQNWQGPTMMPTDDILPAVARLFALLDHRRVRYVLVGGIAMLQYVQGRNTQDIDLIMAISAVQKLPEIQVIEKDRDFARGMFEGLQIDFLLTANPMFAHVQRMHTTVHQYLEQQIPCATVAGLILLKLYALPSLYRQGDFVRVGLYENDIATLMYFHHPDMRRIEKEIERYVSASDLAQIRTIIAELHQRIQHMLDNRR